MSDLTLEREFERVKNAHMISICMSALMYDLECQVEKAINLPFFLIRPQVEQHAMSVIKNEVDNGRFKEFYEVCWDRLQEIIPNELR